MSLYALPGHLFKVTSSAVAPAPKPKESVSAGAPSFAFPSATPQSTFSASSCTDNPLHRRPNEPLTKSSSSASVDTSSSHAAPSSPTSSKGKSNVVIAVKEAKIDPERLIRSLSKKEDPKKATSAKAKIPSDTSPTDEKTTLSSSSSTGSKGQRRRRSKNKADCDPHEEAIKVEFSVSFNGREYTATRSLPRILQFRYDLIEEFRARRMWRERRRKRKEATPPPALSSLSDDEEEEKTIPEIPRLSDDATGRSGFTMLNAWLRPYGPALEGWLKKVIDIVPHDSQCLTQFLWEPLSGQSEQPVNKKKLEKRKSSLSESFSSLGAILETEDADEQYDSDTEDPWLIH